MVSIELIWSKFCSVIDYLNRGMVMVLSTGERVKSKVEYKSNSRFSVVDIDRMYLKIAFNCLAHLYGDKFVLSSQFDTYRNAVLTGQNIERFIGHDTKVDYNLMIEEQTTIGELEVYRPLLNVLKAELEQYADENNLKYYVDSTNFDTDYTRNNIRHNIVPLLNDVNAASFDNLINFSSYYQNINTELKNKVLEAKNDYVISLEEDKVELDKEKLLKNTKEEIYFLLKNILANNFGIFDVKQRALFTIIEDLKSKNNNKSYDLKNNLKIISEYNSIYIHKIEKKCYNDRIELIIDEVDINKVYTFHQSNFLITTMNNLSEVGFNREDLPLVVTTKRDGDRIQRGKVSKKLSRLFIDEKIPRELRDKLPVIRNKDGVLGVLGINTKVNKNKKYDYYINMKG